VTIADLRAKGKAWKAKIPRDYAIVAVLLLASLASFGLGYLAGTEAGQGSLLPVSEAPGAGAETSGQFVASRSGTKYYLPWCAGADRISDANKIWFASESEARAAGYEPASGCDGL
jgi:hypothetical protein